MLIQIVILQDEDETITDIVGMSDFRKADELANNLSVRFGRNRVSRTSLTVDELPTFWGSIPPAAQHTSADTQELDDLEKFRARWRRWLGNKTQRGRPYYIDLMDSNWLRWVNYVNIQCGLEHKPVGFQVSREIVKAIWLDAINHADMDMLRKLDGIVYGEK